MSKIIWSAVATLVTAAVIGFTGWNFAATADAPDKYADKERNRIEHDRMNDKMDTNQREIIDKLDKLREQIIEILNER